MVDREYIFGIYDRAAERVAAQDGRLDGLSDGERAVFVLLYSHANIQNGGFAAMFYNPTGEYWMEAIVAGSDIGARDFADILRDAAGVFPNGVAPKDDLEREQRLYEEDITDAWLTQLDERWFSASPELEDRLVEYAKAHPLAFGASA